MKALSLSRPHLIVMVGIPGAGKSFFAEHFAETFKAPIINRDVLEKELGKEGKAVDTFIELMLRELFKTNQTIIYEGLSATRAQRLTLTQTASKAGYIPLFIWVQTESVEAARRATRRNPYGHTMSAHEFDQAIDSFNVPLASEHAVVISGKHTYVSQLKIVLKHLASAQVQKTTAPIATSAKQQPLKRSSDPSSRNIFIR